ncbi:unnamed protein product, partial [marine sediment metagenome]
SAYARGFSDSQFTFQTFPFTVRLLYKRKNYMVSRLAPSFE